MNIQNTITLDLSAPGAPRRMIAVEGDSGTRMVEILLTENSVTWPVPAGVSASLLYAKPDGTSGWYDTLPGGAPACIISGNAVTVELAPQVLTAPGIVTAAVVLQNGEERLTTLSFYIDVRSCPADAVSKDYYAIAALDRPTQWHCGTAITGISTAPTAFANSGIQNALVGDLYLNTKTGNTYQCTAPGGPTVAQWAYTGSIRGPQGETSPVDTTLSVTGQAADAKATGDALAKKAPSGYAEGGHDTVVAQGTSGIWQYRKWASGKAECWALRAFNDVCANTASGSLYWSDALANAPYPFTFADVPVEIATLRSAYGGWLNASNVNSTSYTGTYRVVRTTSQTSTYACHVSTYVIGRWK